MKKLNLHFRFQFSQKRPAENGKKNQFLFDEYTVCRCEQQVGQVTSVILDTNNLELAHVYRKLRLSKSNVNRHYTQRNVKVSFQNFCFYSTD